MVNGLAPELCDGDEPAKDDVYGIHSVDFEPPNCQNVDDCAIHRGKNLIIRTLSFNSKTDSESVQLQLILGGENRNHPVQVQMASMNLCEHETIRMKLGGRKTDNDHKCHVKKNDPYLLSGMEFFVPRLMPTGNVNLTFLLTGDDDILSCGLIHAYFSD